MNITLFMTLFTIFSAITGICTEGCKKLLNDTSIKYSSNILAFVIACIVGFSGTAFYYVLNSIDFNLVNIVFMILMSMSTAFGAMVGYDKIVQTINQINK